MNASPQVAGSVALVIALLIRPVLAPAEADAQESIRAQLAKLQKQTGTSLLISENAGISLVRFTPHHVAFLSRQIPGESITEGDAAYAAPNGAAVAFRIGEGADARLAISSPIGQLHVFEQISAVSLAGNLCWAHDSKLLLLPTSAPGQAPEYPSFRLLDTASGTIQPTAIEGGEISAQCFSPDDKQIVYTDPAARVVVYDLAEKTSRAIASGHLPSWSPDGSRIAFFGHDGFYAVAPAGGRSELLFHKKNPESALAWSPDSQFAAYVSQAGITECGLVLDVESFAIRVRRLRDNSETRVACSGAFANFSWVVSQSIFSSAAATFGAASSRRENPCYLVRIPVDLRAAELTLVRHSLSLVPFLKGLLVLRNETGHHIDGITQLANYVDSQGNRMFSIPYAASTKNSGGSRADVRSFFHGLLTAPVEPGELFTLSGTNLLTTTILPAKALISLIVASPPSSDAQPATASSQSDPILAQTCGPDLSVALKDVSATPSPLRASGAAHFRVTFSNETATARIALHGKLTNISSQPITAFDALIELNAGLAGGVQNKLETDYFLQFLPLLPGSAETILLEPATIASSYDPRRSSGECKAQIRVLFVQFADGSVFGQSPWGDQLQAVRRTEMAVLADLLRSYESGGTPVLRAALSADLSTDKYALDRSPCLAALLHNLRDTLRRKGPATTVRIIRAYLRNANRHLNSISPNVPAPLRSSVPSQPKIGASLAAQQHSE